MPGTNPFPQRVELILSVKVNRQQMARHLTISIPEVSLFVIFPFLSNWQSASHQNHWHEPN